MKLHQERLLDWHWILTGAVPLLAGWGTDGLVRVDEHDIRHAMTARGWKFYDKSVAAAMKSHSWPLRKPPGKLRVKSVVGWLLSWMIRDLQLAGTEGYTLFLA